MMWVEEEWISSLSLKLIHFDGYVSYCKRKTWPSKIESKENEDESEESEFNQRKNEEPVKKKRGRKPKSFYEQQAREEEQRLKEAEIKHSQN